MDEKIEVELQKQMGDEFDLIIKMLNVVSKTDSPRKRKELIKEMVEMAADEKQRV